MNIEEIKNELKGFSDEEIKALLANVKHENEKRKQNELYKCDLELYKGLSQSLYKFPEDYDYVYDAKAPDNEKQKTNLQGEINRFMEKSILTICDYTLGNYSAVINATDWSVPKRAGRIIPANISSDYMSMKNELLELINKYSKKEVHERIFEEATNK